MRGLIPFMMLAAASAPCAMVTVPGLLSKGIGSKVERFSRRNLHLIRCGQPLLEVPVTSRLRELIQRLGEAIHESVIESEQIAGVVQDIRKHGFDVLLMLEATIGLNEVAAAQTKRLRRGTGGRGWRGIRRPHAERSAFSALAAHFRRRRKGRSRNRREINAAAEPD